MENNGYIKLYRKLLDNVYASKPNYVSLWVFLLLKANHKENDFLWNGEKKTIKAGQFITGRNILSKETGIRASTIEDILKLFEKQQQIRQEKTNKFRIITIVNWEKYQGDNEKNRQQKRQQSDNKPTTKQQQTDTNKNDNNDKNEKNIILATPGVAGKEINDLIDLFKSVNPTHERLFRDKTQRACVERLLKKLGSEKLKGAIEILPKTNSMEFSPQIFTPYDLEKKLGALINFVKKEKNNINKNQIPIL